MMFSSRIDPLVRQAMQAPRVNTGTLLAEALRAMLAPRDGCKLAFRVPQK